MMRAANERLGEIKGKLGLGISLTDDEMSDAAAIIELREIWADRAAEAEKEAAAAVAADALRDRVQVPAVAGRIVPLRGEETASLLTSVFR